MSAVITLGGAVASERDWKALLSRWGGDLRDYVRDCRKCGDIRVVADDAPDVYPRLVRMELETDDVDSCRWLLHDETFKHNWRDGAMVCVEGSVIDLDDQLKEI